MHLVPGYQLLQDTECQVFFMTYYQVQEPCYKVHALTVVQTFTIHCGIGFQDVIECLRTDFLFEMIKGTSDVYLYSI